MLILILDRFIQLRWQSCYPYAMFAGDVSSFSLSVVDYPPGVYNLTIDAVDIYGQSVTVVANLFLSGIRPVLVENMFLVTHQHIYWKAACFAIIINIWYFACSVQLPILMSASCLNNIIMFMKCLGEIDKNSDNHPSACFSEL